MSVLYHTIPVIGQSLADLIGLMTTTIRDVLANVPASSIAHRRDRRRGLPEDSPCRCSGGPANRSVEAPNRLGVIIELRLPETFDPSVTPNLTEFTEFFGIPTPEIPPSANLQLNLTETVQSRMARITLSRDQNVAEGRCDRYGRGSRLRLQDANGDTLATV